MAKFLKRELTKRERKENLEKKAQTTIKKLKRKERKAADKMAAVITRMDNRNDDLAEKTTEAINMSSHRIFRLRKKAEQHRRTILIYFSAIILISIGLIVLFNYSTAYEYAYNGRALGLVKNQKDVLRIADVVAEKLTEEHDTEIVIDKDKDITFRRVVSLNRDVDNTEIVLNKLTYMQDMMAAGYGIFIDGKRAAVLGSEEEADNVLQEVKNEFLISKKGVKYEGVGFAEDVQIKQVDTRLGSLQDTEEVKTKLLTGSLTQKIYIVLPGDTAASVAREYDTTTKKLEKHNPDLDVKKLKVGAEVVLVDDAPMVTVQTVETATYKEYISYKTIFKDYDRAYKGVKKVKVKGEKGEKTVVARITRNNGKEASRKILNTKVTKKQVNKIVLVGTKKKPPTMPSGTYIYPANGRLSSPFGYRWGRMHNGIDLACSYGTPIRAADGGTVIGAGYKGSYGNVVEISHGSGIITRYAHCSSLVVSAGDKVYQGQHIANVGSTGRSTGPHCHFEIEVNGTFRNPLSYLQ